MARGYKIKLVKRLVVVFLALSLTLLAIIGIVDFSNCGPPPGIRYVDVAVAAFDLRPGEKLLSAHFRTKRIDYRTCLEGLLIEGEEAAYIGYYARFDIPVGTPIFKGMLTLDAKN